MLLEGQTTPLPRGEGSSGLASSLWAHISGECAGDDGVNCRKTPFSRENHQGRDLRRPRGEGIGLVPTSPELQA